MTTKCKAEPLAGSCVASASGFVVKQAVPSYICNAAAWLWRFGGARRNGAACLWPQPVRRHCAVGVDGASITSLAGLPSAAWTTRGRFPSSIPRPRRCNRVRTVWVRHPIRGVEERVRLVPLRNRVDSGPEAIGNEA